MAFSDFETSNGQPVELLTFVNGTTILRYTNANTTLTIDALEYDALEYTRNAPSISKDSDDSQIRLTLPSSNPVVGLYRNILQSTITSLTIERFHNNDPAQGRQVFWKGEIGSVTVNNAIATILATPLSQGTDELPRYTYQGKCNYFLYAQNTCRLVKNDFRFVSNIATIDTTGLQIGISGLRAAAAALDLTVSGALTSAELDSYWLNGYCDLNGQLRRIVRSPAGSGSPENPDIVEIPFPFISAAVGQEITIYAGCDRSTDACVRKFNNLINYGGWPTVPVVNPFETELPPGTRPAETGQKFWS